MSNMNQPKLLSNTTPKDSKKNDNVKNITLTWLMGLTQFVTLTALDIPGASEQPVQPNNAGWYKFVLDPASVKENGNVVFGVGRTLQVAISRPTSFVSADGATFHIVGRVAIYIPTTGQQFWFASKAVAGAMVPSGTQQVLEQTNDILPIILHSNDKISVYIEQDQTSSGGPLAAPSNVVVVNLSNFEMPNSGIIA